MTTSCAVVSKVAAVALHVLLRRFLEERGLAAVRRDGTSRPTPTWPRSSTSSKFVTARATEARRISGHDSSVMS
jgi:hypothetical protein